jgi:hypothetical protein
MSKRTVLDMDSGLPKELEVPDPVIAPCFIDDSDQAWSTIEPRVQSDNTLWKFGIVAAVVLWGAWVRRHEIAALFGW